MTTYALAEKTEVPCAFCHGAGLDPFGIMSGLSSCMVCGGTGKVEVEMPYTRCAFCEGTGVYPHSRLTCTACEGFGVSPVVEPNETCPHCHGTGQDPQSEAGFYCDTCHGTGLVAKSS